MFRKIYMTNKMTIQGTVLFNKAKRDKLNCLAFTVYSTFHTCCSLSDSSEHIVTSIPSHRRCIPLFIL